MKKNNALYIRCDASQRRGFGHLHRCLTIAAAFKRKNIRPVFLQSNSDHQALSLIDQSGFESYQFPEKKSYAEEIKHYPENLEFLFLDLVHRDTLANPSDYASYLKNLKEKSRTIVALDGLFEEAIHKQDMPEIDCVMQPYIGAEEDSRPACKIWITGGQYTILEDCYQNIPRRVISNRAQNILVTFGGADPQGITLHVMSALKDGPDDISIRIAVGPYFSQEHIAAIDQIAKQAGDRFCLIKNEMDLLPHYLWADIAVGGSGTSRYEFAATGLPSIFTSIYPYHDKLSRVYTRNGLSLYLGYYENLAPHDWFNATNILIQNQEMRVSLSENCYKKIDTHGTDRLVTHLNKSVFSF